jgi:hypothetical protein
MTSRLRLVILLFVLTSSFTGCAFRESETPSNAAGEVGPKPAVVMRIKGGERAERIVSVRESTWSTSYPFFLPAEPAASIALEVQIPSASLANARLVTAEATFGTEVRSIAVDWTPRSGGVLLTFPSFAEGLTRDQAIQVPLEIHFWSDGVTEEKLLVEFRTPPGAPMIKQTPLHEWKARGRVLPKGVDRLVSASFNLSLLQVIEVSHSSDLAEQVLFPLQTSGKLVSPSNRITVQQAFCSSVVNRQPFDDVLSESLYLLPLVEGLESSFMTYLDSGARTNQTKLAVRARETVLLGLYGSGDRAASVTEQGFKPVHFETLQVVQSCKTRCGSLDGRDMSYWNGQAASHWQTQGFPGLSQSCLNAHCRPVVSGQPYTPELCSHCAEFELGNQTAPWAGTRFCRSNEPGNPWGYPAREMWIVEKITSQVPAGIENGPLLVEVSPTSRNVQVRYVSEEITENAPVRDVPDAIAAQSVQAPGANREYGK